jgi:hypothetical protein
MDSPQALSTVYAVAAQALAVTEPLESLRFEKPIPYTRTNLVAATTNVTGLDISALVGPEVEEDAVFQACGLVLAKAVEYAVSQQKAEVLWTFRFAFDQLIEAYCKFSKQSVTHMKTTVSVTDAVALEVELMKSWPHVWPRRQNE